MTRSPSWLSKSLTIHPVSWTILDRINLPSDHSHSLPSSVSGFYAECPTKRMYVTGYAWTKSRFLGLSLGVHFIGKGQCHPTPLHILTPLPSLTHAHNTHCSSPPFTGLWGGIHSNPAQCLCKVSTLSILDCCVAAIDTSPSHRSILTYPWMEMGGKCHLECAQTGYAADLEFHCKVRVALVATRD